MQTLSIIFVEIDRERPAIIIKSFRKPWTLTFDHPSIQANELVTILKEWQEATTGSSPSRGQLDMHEQKQEDPIEKEERAACKSEEGDREEWHG